jgi:hypothetical protein
MAGPQDAQVGHPDEHGGHPSASRTDPQDGHLARRCGTISQQTKSSTELIIWPKTIAQLTALAATPDATDELVIADGGVTKKISVSNLTAATLGLAGTKAVLDGVNLSFGTTTGTKLGTATTQKIGFYNVTPVDQPATVTDPTGGVTQDAEARTAINAIIDRLQELGLIA